MATKEYFPGIGKIKFEGVESKNPMAFRYYDAEKVVMGKKMKDWLKFSMAWLKELTSLVAVLRTSHGKEILTRYRLLKTKWMQASNLCRKWVLNTTVSTM